MPPRHRRRSPALEKGLAPGESLRRYLVPIKPIQSAFWSWVSSEVSQPADITQEHRLIACGLSEKNNNSFCANKYAISRSEPPQTPEGPHEHTKGDTAEDVIVVSDEEQCSKKLCKDNPNCLNYLGQDKWERGEDMLRDFLSAAALGHDPSQDSRDPDLPVGLKNLGATCYANASLQVWFRNLAFRNGVFHCQPASGSEKGFKDSPLFQLQVTFTALQESSGCVFNPTLLVESLQLRAAEQQDAQEFSKLFISHLDTEFRKQSAPELRSLVVDQFQGTQVYGTICNTCQYRSEKSTTFLEIEIRFEGSSNLEDCITKLLQEESLTGDNQYRCPRCNSLQDATRYTELRQLPPVLHFSLLRFVYDSSTMERRKSKYTVSFPAALDMNQFLKHDMQRDGGDDVYELQGILLHKGQSAYHGHYEAQVYDIEKQSWFQFNDEIVTKVKTLGDKKGSSGAEESLSKLKARPAKKRCRTNSHEKVESNQLVSPLSKIISSRDAYMLIYVRRDHQKTTNQNTSKLPQEALEVVYALNKAHEEDCRTYAHREQVVKARFQSIREQVMDVYRTWNATSAANDTVILSQQRLQAWLSEDCINLAKVPSGSNTRLEAEPRESLDENSLASLDSVLCIHKKLDPNKAKNMKRIKRMAYQKMVELTQSSCILSPSPQDVCEDCVLREFKERLYNIEHPKLVKEFDQISHVQEGSLGYWISKKWLRDWRLSKPKMHKLSEDDPSPDSFEYREHVQCEHNSLSLNSLSRRKISGEAVRLLKRLFPSWVPTCSDAEPCAVCDVLAHTSKEGKRESRQRAEEEKALLRHMYEGMTFTGGGDTYAIIPISFYRGWLSWLNNPEEHVRANQIDNSPFLCEHELLIFDPNCPSDIEMTVTIIRRSDWEILETLYDSGPLISLRSDQDVDDKVYTSDIPTCEACRLKRKTEWVSTDITVQLLRGKKSDTSTSRQPIATYTNRNNTRQSKRLREARENEKRRFAVTKVTTVKDIKTKIQEGFKIPTICQRLFFRGQELDDNETTVGSLEIFSDEVLELREQAEVYEIDIDSDEGRPTKKQRREAERGFGGTLLSTVAGEYDQGSSPGNSGPHIFSQTLTEKACPACTLVNAYDAVACTVCDTLFV